MPFFDMKSVAKPKDENNDSRIIMLNGKKVRVLGIRRLTPTECARLQTIPEWYDWYGDYQQELLNMDISQCKSAPLKAVVSLLQTEKQDIATSIISAICGVEQSNSEGAWLINPNSVVLKVAEDNAKLQKVCVSSITNNGFESSQLTQTRNVLYVTNQLDIAEDAGFAVSITGIGSNMQTLCMQITESSYLTEILDGNTTKLAENIFIEKLQKKFLEETSVQKKLSTISTLISWTIAKKICISAQTTNISVCIASSNVLQEHSLTWELSSLKMGSIKSISDSSAYRVLGNGWTVSVISWFFSFLPKEWFGNKAEPPQDEQPIINQQQG